MPIGKEWFTWKNKHGVEIGSRVRHADGRTGTVVNIWYGIEESIDVKLDDGTQTTWYPAEGMDDVELVSDRMRELEVEVEQLRKAYITAIRESCNANRLGAIKESAWLACPAESDASRYRKALDGVAIRLERIAARLPDGPSKGWIQEVADDARAARPRCTCHNSVTEMWDPNCPRCAGQGPALDGGDA